ncbi:TPA: hypothetical protein ACVO3F_004216, partial [Vibrio diabolicus]
VGRHKIACAFYGLTGTGNNERTASGESLKVMSVPVWKHVVCVLMRHHCPVLPVFLGKADKLRQLCWLP